MLYKIFKKTVTPGYTDMEGNQIITGKPIEKLFIVYEGGKADKLTEYYGRSLNTPECEIREGYNKHPESL